MKRVLVVDDSPVIRQQVGAALTQVGFEMIEATDGMQGVEALRQNEVAVVVCDINMPLMNGLEMLEAIKAQSIKPKVPVIMLTTEGQPAQIQRAKAAGAKGWMVKPFKAETLAAIVQKLAT